MDLAGVLRLTGATALVVTHDHDEAFTLADRVAVMRAGRIVQVGPPDEVWRHPADEDTARFLGCGLFVPATVVDGVATCELGTVTLPWAPSGEVTLGLRPNALRLTDTGDVTGKLMQSVHRRDHVRLQIRLDAGDRLVDAVAGIADAPEPGTTVHLTLDQDGLAIIRP
jgi:thiamine transport system ATP-binding protein